MGQALWHTREGGARNGHRSGFVSFLEAQRWLDTETAAGRFVIFGAEQSYIARIEPAGVNDIIVWLERSDEFPVKHKHFAVKASLKRAGREFWSYAERRFIPVAERH